MEQLCGTAGGPGQWERQAWIVGLLAAELGVALEGQALMLCDVRDLLALRQRLQGELARASRPPVTMDWRLRLKRLWTAG